jgi:hypothetical protein
MFSLDKVKSNRRDYESIAAPSWMRNSSIASLIGGGKSPHQGIT